MNVGKDVFDLRTTVHNKIVLTQKSIDKVTQSFLELSQNVRLSHTVIGYFDKEEISHVQYGITKGQEAGKKGDMTKALIECELEQCRIAPDKHSTNTGLLSTMGWNNNNHGLRVEEEAFKSDYILFPGKKLKAIYKHYKTAVTGKKVPAWIKTLVVKLKSGRRRVGDPASPK